MKMDSVSCVLLVKPVFLTLAFLIGCAFGAKGVLQTRMTCKNIGYLDNLGGVLGLTGSTLSTGDSSAQEMMSGTDAGSRSECDAGKGIFELSQFFGSNVQSFSAIIFVASVASAFLKERNTLACLLSETQRSGIMTICAWAGLFGRGAGLTSTE